jgi:hypothetical protein
LGPTESRFSAAWRKNLVDQPIIIRSLEWIDESEALQDEPILHTPARCADARSIAFVGAMKLRLSRSAAGHF